LKTTIDSRSDSPGEADSARGPERSRLYHVADRDARSPPSPKTSSMPRLVVETENHPSTPYPLEEIELIVEERLI
jgi:hypothetical protein